MNAFYRFLVKLIFIYLSPFLFFIGLSAIDSNFLVPNMAEWYNKVKIYMNLTYNGKSLLEIPVFCSLIGYILELAVLTIIVLIVLIILKKLKIKESWSLFFNIQMTYLVTLPLLIFIGNWAFAAIMAWFDKAWVNVILTFTGYNFGLQFGNNPTTPIDANLGSIVGCLVGIKILKLQFQKLSSLTSITRMRVQNRN